MDNMNEVCFDTQDHPELDGMKEGDTLQSLRVDGAKVTKVEGSSVYLDLSGAEITNENQADKSLKDMMAPKMDDAKTADKNGSEEE